MLEKSVNNKYSLISMQGQWVKDFDEKAVNKKKLDPEEQNRHINVKMLLMKSKVR
jgi:serine protease inhibitor